MDVVLWVLFGAITAWIAEIFVGTHTRRRVLGVVALGVIGAVFAGATMWLIAGNNEGYPNYYSLLLAVAGSLVVVALLVRKKA